jgi:hypothetical protein
VKLKHVAKLSAMTIAGFLLVASQASAGWVPITQVALSGVDIHPPDPVGNLSASADFFRGDGAGNSIDELMVVLTNTSPYDVLVQRHVLTGMFFDINVGPLTPVSAMVGGGSSVFYGSSGGGNVGGEWAYDGGLSGAPNGATSGISSAGFGLFGSPNFNGPDLAPPPAIDGLNYGITSAGDNLATGQAAVTGSVPLIQNSVTFRLAGLGDGLVSISNVSFQYGTTLNDFNVTNEVPEPLSLFCLSAGLATCAGAFRRRRRK